MWQRLANKLMDLVQVNTALNMRVRRIMMIRLYPILELRRLSILLPNLMLLHFIKRVPKESYDNG